MKIPTPAPTTDRTPYAIEGPARILIVSDVHVPYHDPDAIRAAIAFGRDRGPISHVLVNGDLLDAYHLSRFEKDPTARTFAQELKDAVQIVKIFARVFASAQIVIKLGNHEKRFETYLQGHAPALADLPGFTLEEILQKELPDVDVVSEWRNITAGDLLIVHGHEVGRGSGGTNPARWLLQRTGVSTICGHFHRTDSHQIRNGLGEKIHGHTIGALCQLSPDYLPRNQWNHGAAFVELTAEGEYLVENKIFQ
jgi:predicted phosphodiesterase